MGEGGGGGGGGAGGWEHALCSGFRDHDVVMARQLDIAEPTLEHRRYESPGGLMSCELCLWLRFSSINGSTAL